MNKAINLRYTDAFNTGNFVIFEEVIVVDSRSRNADALKSLSRYACFRLVPPRCRFVEQLKKRCKRSVPLNGKFTTARHLVFANALKVDFRARSKGNH